MLSPLPREAARSELMDRLDAPAAELTRSLSDIARLNRIGGTQTIRRHVAPFLARLRPGETLRILDIGTGAADIPLALATWARRRGRRVRVTALEMHPTIWRHAAHATKDTPEVRIVAANGLEPPIRPRSVDVALCSLVLHHLPEEAVVALLRQLAALVRLGFVISDFRRGRIAWAAVWLVTRATACGRMARHDGPLSVRRAYTTAELTRLAERAGLPDVRWQRAPAFRQVGVWTRESEGAGRAG
jgi:2-polyprenyl-3-methyl-5-hydroxy-6-metoxy-1,4-benzoquinol methylase